VINHQTGSAGNFPQGNALHVLNVASDGTLSESPDSPLFLPSNIPAGDFPQGVAVVAAKQSVFLEELDAFFAGFAIETGTDKN